MKPGVMLEQDDCPETPNPLKHKVYYSYLAKIKFAASWVRCNIASTASQLAQFCASAGPSHWAARHHVMDYLEENPRFNFQADIPARWLRWGSMVFGL